MMSVLIVISGIVCLNLFTSCLNCSTVCPRLIAFRTSSFPLCIGMCRNLKIFGFFMTSAISSMNFGRWRGFPMPTRILKSPGISTSCASSLARFVLRSNP